MVTGRFYTFLVVAVMMYLFANQTQVNWLYVTSAMVAGVIPAAWLLNRAAMRGISATRQIHSENEDIHEGDDVSITLTLRGTKRQRASHLSVTETCPLLAPDDPRHTQAVFIPALPARDTVELNYEAPAYLRGLHQFPALHMKTGAPFGLFQKQTLIHVPSPVLVYPEVRPLKRLDMLDRQLTVQQITERAGVGNEVIGVRPYRSGDSPRHIHWRSVARTGRLISKEFAEETQPGLSLVIDRHLARTTHTHPKHNPFEWGIKVAVSIADYARKRRYPLYLHADEGDYPAPHGAVTWDALMQYMARVPAAHQTTLPAIIERGGFRPYVVVIVTEPDEDLLVPLIGLNNSGARLLVILSNPATFPGMGKSSHVLADALRADGVDAVELVYGEDWTDTLSGHQTPLDQTI